MYAAASLLLHTLASKPSFPTDLLSQLFPMQNVAVFFLRFTRSTTDIHTTLNDFEQIVALITFSRSMFSLRRALMQTA